MASPKAVPNSHRCKFFLPHKQRQCSQSAKTGLDYCSLHLPPGAAAAAGYEQRPGDIRVQCPYGNHTVPARHLTYHIKECQDRKVAERWANEPFYVPSINAGPGPPVLLPEAPPELADSKGRVDTPACRRQAFAVNLGPVALNNLISRLDTVSKHINEHSPDTFSILGEEELEKLAATASSGESHLPFNNKHGAQHASLIGNMSTFGLFKHPKDTMFIEFGAGKGYLTNALAALVSGADHLVMMDNQKFKLLADRGLRDKKMQRVRCDIANFEPSGLVGFEKSLYSVAFGKHLCGAATDLTLRCCLRSLLKEKEKMNMKDKEDKEETVTGRGSSTSEEEDRNSLEEELQVQPASTLNSLLGLGVATCCHHRCTWQHYVAQDVILELGFTPEEFEMISHFTSWALCGHGASNSKISRERKSGTEGTTEGVSNSAGNGGGGAAAAADGNGNGNGVKDKDEVAMNEEEEINEEENLNEQGNGGGWRLHHSFSREQRQLIGRQCKRLIDYGRVEWLRRNGFEAIEVLYCDPESSGENRLVLAKPN